MPDADALVRVAWIEKRFFDGTYQVRLFRSYPFDKKEHHPPLEVATGSTRNQARVDLPRCRGGNWRPRALPRERQRTTLHATPPRNANDAKWLPTRRPRSSRKSGLRQCRPYRSRLSVPLRMRNMPKAFYSRRNSTVDLDLRTLSQCGTSIACRSGGIVAHHPPPPGPNTCNQITTTPCPQI